MQEPEKLLTIIIVMKKRALNKDFWMEIRTSLTRFLSILLIVALGVAFFAGIQSSAPDMRVTEDAYFDDANLMDIRVMGTLGLTGSDLDAIAAVDGVGKVSGAYMEDVYSGDEESLSVLHFESFPEGMNEIAISSGTFPDKEGDCFLDESFAKEMSYEPGDTLEIMVADENDSTLVRREFTIAGIGYSPTYIAFTRGSTTLGTGSISGFVYVLPDEFDTDIYGVAYVEVEGARKKIAYTDGYDDCVEEVQKKIEEIEDVRCDIRYDEVRGEAEEELEDAKAEAESELEEARGELLDAESELADGREDLADAQQEVAEAESEYEKGREELEENSALLEEAALQLTEGKEELDSGEKEYQDGLLEFLTQTYEGGKELRLVESGIVSGQKKLDERREEYEAGLLEAAKREEELNAALQNQESVQTDMDLDELMESQEVYEEELEESRAALEEAGEQLQIAEEELAQGQAEVDAGYEKIYSGYQELTDARADLDAGWEEYESSHEEFLLGQQELEDGEKDLKNARLQLAKSRTQISDGEKEIADNEEKIEQGWADYEDGKAKADEKIADAEEEIENIEVPSWYVNDRSVLPDNTGYGENADRMTNIASALPIIFFLIAALISLTTMTRMVEEERTQIGTYKALGYGKFDIARKYLEYAFLATILGSILGILVGEKILPWVIIQAYGIMYSYNPGILTPYNMGFGIVATVMALISTMGATLWACYRELQTVPSELMRPPSPKQGKRVFLERIPIIWNRLNFNWKSTVRNLLRYKSRFFMTVLGIGGCMGLLLVGYGLRDSIMDVVVLQYNELQTYDAMLFVDTDSSAGELTELENAIDTDGRITASGSFYMQSVDIAQPDAKDSGKEWTIYTYVPKEPDQAGEFLHFRDRKTGEEYTLSDEGAIITEKIAKEFGLSVGDTIALEREDKDPVEVPIADICENYLYHYLYLTPALYEEVYGEEPEYNSIFFGTEKDQDTVEEIGTDLLAMDAALNISYTSTLKEEVEDMLSALDLVILVLIISAGLLAFVVLYNLNNININERTRELATLKVLGFTDMEVANYVYRENILLTIFGAAAGCVLGRIMHVFIIQTVEVDSTMFGRQIYLQSFVIGILFTLVFSVIVNFVMYFKLKKIDMIESLKSVE